MNALIGRLRRAEYNCGLAIGVAMMCIGHAIGDPEHRGFFAVLGMLNSVFGYMLACQSNEVADEIVGEE